MRRFDDDDEVFNGIYCSIRHERLFTLILYHIGGVRSLSCHCYFIERDFHTCENKQSWKEKRKKKVLSQPMSNMEPTFGLKKIHRTNIMLRILNSFFLWILSLIIFLSLTARSNSKFFKFSFPCSSEFDKLEIFPNRFPPPELPPWYLKSLAAHGYLKLFEEVVLHLSKRSAGSSVGKGGHCP